MFSVPTRLGIIILLVVILIPTIVPALERNGTISENETWHSLPDGASGDSPILVTGMLTVANGVRLTIEPGVEILFSRGTGIIVNGDLVARGTENDSILFTFADDAEGLWGGIYIRGTTGASTAYNDAGEYTDQGSVFEFCIIEQAGDQAVEIGSAMEISSTNPLIANSTIRNCRGGSGTIHCNNLAKPLIRDSHIHNNHAERGGALSAGIGTSPILHHNIFAYNEATDNGGAIFMSLASAEVIGNGFFGNRATGNGGVFSVALSQLTVRDNAFIGNSSHARSPVFYFSERVNSEIHNNMFDSCGVVIHLQNSTEDVNASGNWWGYPSGFNAQEVFRDRYRDRNERYVRYDPLLSAPPMELINNPTHIDSIILCRDDSFTDEIPFGVAQGAPLRIRLTGTDGNQFFRDQIQVSVTSAFDIEGITLPLMETDVNSGVFIGYGRVAAVTDQSRYFIGDEEGGEVHIFAPFDPSVQAVYLTMSPKPACDPFVITLDDNEDFQHILDHQPEFQWGYFDVVERAQQKYKVSIAPVIDTASGETGQPIWETGDIRSDNQSVNYDGVYLEDGVSYLGTVSVWNGELWSDEERLSFRMNSLPTIPMPIHPMEDEKTLSKAPTLVA
ncbi:MAG: right-handed parallel beta-helix repeat-containing protein, partial [Candidatus Electryoneaceae bacterium]|nr:right-handed parallel beta-helix repeat-containing protein [Candidatus Electryoneaceae bacterium]